MGNVKEITTSDFTTEVIERSREIPVVVDFWATWCGPCKVLGPTLERLAGEPGAGWELAKVDVDQNQQLAIQFGVQGIPTVVAFKDGRPVSRFTGAIPEAQVRQFLDQLIPSELDLMAEAAEQALDRGDDHTAEQAFRAILAQDPGHEAAGLGLAGMLLEHGDREGALATLALLPRSEDVKRLEAYARLSGAGDEDLDALAASAASGDEHALLAFGRGLIGAGRHTEALEPLVRVVALRGEAAEEARLMVLDIFELLGSDSAVTAEYRRKLASALF
jgi:putative thioredoxin